MGHRQVVFFLLMIFVVSQLQLAALTAASTAPGSDSDATPAAIAEVRTYGPSTQATSGRSIDQCNQSLVGDGSCMLYIWRHA